MSTREVTRQQIHEVGQAVAAEMDKLQPEVGWHYVPTYWREELTNDARIRAEGGRALDFGVAPYPTKGRYDATGVYPNTADGKPVFLGSGSPGPSITMSMAKAPTALAKDIVRRFLPPYAEHLSKVNAQVERTNGYLADKQHTRCRMEMAGCQFWKHSEDCGDLPNLPAGYGRVQINSDSVQLELRSLPVETAVQIVQLLRTARAEAEAAD